MSVNSDGKRQYIHSSNLPRNVSTSVRGEKWHWLWGKHSKVLRSQLQSKFCPPQNPHPIQWDDEKVKKSYWNSFESLIYITNLLHFQYDNGFGSRKVQFGVSEDVRKANESILIRLVLALRKFLDRLYPVATPVRGYTLMEWLNMGKPNLIKCGKPTQNVYL